MRQISGFRRVGGSLILACAIVLLTSGCALVVGNRGLEDAKGAQKDLTEVKVKVENIDRKLEDIQKEQRRQSPEGMIQLQKELDVTKVEIEKLRIENEELKKEKERLMKLVETQSAAAAASAQPK